MSYRLNDQCEILDSSERLYDLKMPIVGLTGGIAAGKSTVVNAFKSIDIPVICADKLIKKIYQQEESINFLEDNFPDCLDGKKPNFKKLRVRAFEDSSIRKALENFLYPKIPDVFNEEARTYEDRPLIVYDVPLLFEKGLDNLVDLVLCIYCSREVQIQRLIQRDSITEELANNILDAQMSLDDKRINSNYVINNSESMARLSWEFKVFMQAFLEKIPQNFST